MIISIGNSFTKVSSFDNDDEQAWLYDFLSYKNVAAHWQRSGNDRIRLFSVKRARFPTGLLPIVRKGAVKAGISVREVDARGLCPELNDVDLSAPPWCMAGKYEFQRKAIDDWLKGGEEEEYPLPGRGIIWAPTGCHAPGTKILMADGSLQPVERVQVFDKVMGIDGPRTVLDTHTGREKMARVVPVKGEPFTVNLSHILTLVRTNDGTKAVGKLIDVSVRDWLSWSKTKKHIHKLVRCKVHKFSNETELNKNEIDPWILGCLLGDGCLKPGVIITNPEPVILEEFCREAKRFGCVVRERISGGGCPTRHAVTARGAANEFLEALTRYGLRCGAGAKFVPRLYKTSTWETRRQVLAGLLDTDGSAARGGWDFISKSEQLANDVAFLCRSLGLAAYVKPSEKYCQTGAGGIYYRVSISGDAIIVPTRIKSPSSRKQIKDVLRTGISVELLNVGKYHGFSVDGDHRYLLGDFTLTHNSGKGNMAVAIGHMLPGHTLFAVHRGHLAQDIQARWNDMAGSQGEPDAGMIGEGVWNVGERFTCASLQTLYARLSSDEFKLLIDKTTAVIFDEAHVAPAKTFNAVLAFLYKARWRLGLSGTPLDRSDRRTMVAVGAIGPIVSRVRSTTLQELGVIAVPTVHIIPVTQSALSAYADWHTRYEAYIVRSDKRNAAVIAAAQYAYDEGETPGMIFVKAIHHGFTLQKSLTALGMSVRFISGSASLFTRKSACEQLAAGRLDFIIATKVFSEGVNIPSLATIINAQAGKSVVGTLQQTGRGMRVTDDKTTVTVWDFGDKGDTTFHKHAEARIAAYQREGYKCILDKHTWPESLHSRGSK